MKITAGDLGSPSPQRIVDDTQLRLDNATFPSALTNTPTRAFGKTANIGPTVIWTVVLLVAFAILVVIVYFLGFSIRNWFRRGVENEAQTTGHMFMRLDSEDMIGSRSSGQASAKRPQAAPMRVAFSLPPPNTDWDKGQGQGSRGARIAGRRVISV